MSITEQVENYLTDNINVSNSFFDNILEEHDESSIKLFYCYHLLKSGDKESSIKLFKTIKENSNVRSLYLLVNAILFYYDNVSSCKEMLLKSILIDNKNKWSYLELFYLLKNTEENYLAWDYLEKAILIDENFNEAKYQRILQFDSIENCSLIINDILAFPQTYVNEYILNTLGSAYYNCGQIGNAVKILKGSLEINKTPEAYYLLGAIEHNKDRNFDNALKYYNLSINEDPSYIDCLNSKAWLLFDMRNIDEAELLFKKIINLNKSQSSYIQIIQFYLCISDLDNALSYNKTMIIEYGEDYISDSFDIIYLIKKNNKEILNNKVLKFKKKYNEEQIDWLKNMILDYGSV
ncbi:MAG: tetratricopeptide repeat protein [Flavobacterium sp.]|nr:tetratricopeptide repeat protein [Flavobacterium sp.]